MLECLSGALMKQTPPGAATGRGGAPAAWEVVLWVSGPLGPCPLLERPTLWVSGKWPGLRGRWQGRGLRPGTCVEPQVISDSLHPIFLGFGGGGSWGEEAGSGIVFWTSRPLSAGLWTCRRCRFKFSGSSINQVRGASEVILIMFLI